MKSIIQSRINAINDALAWIKANKPDQYEQRFLQLVNERCRLRKIQATELHNPAIAAYGESQKGKSYVITNLLSDNGSPFTVTAPEREFDFVKEINPITNNVEATGVVTRFTTFSNSPSRYNPEYPVLIKLLGVAEVATILCDGYHSDITDYSSYSDAEIQQIAADIYDRYSSMPEIADTPISEDDIIEMKQYLTRSSGGNTQSLTRSPYFDRLALVARRIPRSEWADVFSPLWHRNATLTRLFSLLIDALGRLNFASEVYLPISAVLNNNLTLMSVQRINELGSDGKNEPAYFTDVLITLPNSQTATASNFDKSELSALCAEAVFKIEDRFLNSSISLDMTMIDDPTVRGHLSDEPFRKDILRNTDLLDFPGARARNQLKEENLDKTDTKSNLSNDANVYLRGKVAYLFNRYSDAGLINMLLFCHDNAQRNDDTLYLTIENWIKQYVGDTPEARRRTLQLTGGVAPFFIIATKFNIDMTMADADANDTGNSRTAIDQRWTDRFNVVLYKEVIHGNDAQWFQNWTNQGESFKNTYLLRDYKYSGNTGKGNNLYLGFAETGRETQSAMPDVYYRRLRESFIESPHVKLFFENPEISWDVAATLNNDGALWLFRKMAVASSHLHQTRHRLNEDAVKQISSSIYDILKGYYHDDDAAKQLIQNMDTACAIRRELIFASNADNYFFGRMIQSLQTSEKEVYNSLYDIVNSPELNADSNSFDNYELIRKDIGGRLDRCSADNDNAQKWQCLMMAYGLPDRQAAEDYLARRNINPDLLFAGNYKRRINSVIIAEAIFNKWIDDLKTPRSLANLTANELFDPIEMSSLIANIESTAKAIDLEGLIEADIADAVNVLNNSAISIAPLADRIATIINNFVSDLGFSHRTASQLSDAERIVDENPMRFDPFTHVVSPRKTNFDEDELTALFNRLYQNPDAVTPAFEQNYYRWIEYMIISFLLKGKVIDYDVAANRRMGQLLETIKAENPQ